MSVLSLAEHEVVHEGVRDATGRFILGGQSRQHVDRQRRIDARSQQERPNPAGHVLQDVGSFLASNGLVDGKALLAGQAHGHRHQRMLVTGDAVSGPGDRPSAFLQQGQGQRYGAARRLGVRWVL